MKCTRPIASLAWRSAALRRRCGAPSLNGDVRRRRYLMQSATLFPIDGGCDCKAVRYRLISAPLVVHCCHCRWCQRESGASFALNAMFESDRVLGLGVEPEIVNTPSQSGKGQKIARCTRCKVAVWSHYAGSGPLTKFVRVGTLDNPDALPPDVHIFTSSMQPWIELPASTPAFLEYYDRSTIWSKDSLARFEQLRPLIEAYKRGAHGAV